MEGQNLGCIGRSASGPSNAGITSRTVLPTLGQARLRQTFWAGSRLAWTQLTCSWLKLNRQTNTASPAALPVACFAHVFVHL
eukprot:6310797-Karenia_brevis.AAC.1